MSSWRSCESCSNPILSCMCGGTAEENTVKSALAKAVTPITPAQARAEAEQAFPPEIIEAFNELIRKGGGKAVTVSQDEVVALIRKKLGGKDFGYEYLNVEPLFEKAGWRVDYDKPGYNEDYDATFTFTPKRGKR